jgi:hypothetical protein
VQASAVPRPGGPSCDVLHAGTVQREEEERGACGAVTPGVGDLVLVGHATRDVVRDDEALPIGVAERHQVLRPTQCSFRQMREAQLSAGESERCNDFMTIYGDSTYHLLTSERGWSHNQVIEWLCDTLPVLLLADPG